MDASPPPCGTAHVALITAPGSGPGEFLSTSLGALRGHPYHHSRHATEPAPLGHARRLSGSEAEPVYRVARYFLLAPRPTAALFRGEPAWQPSRSHEEIPA
ncbi:hypothetical protein [Halomonas nitroreducens]|uniref:Uncharacterized protein n=1 Tax=Halomonas nitroreducens TaxID=447425 RepID=A0A431V1U9_9GAMM|nr:hypothetical protein [Halomonas nitroreducens]RTR02374.1 hypothetical protein EKG36_12290 [Halomonas nitroreducens]